LPTDDAAAGEVWAADLRADGHRVRALGRLAPSIAADKAIALDADGLLLAVNRHAARPAVQALVGHLQHRGAKVPVLLTGPAVDLEFAQWVAVPQGGTPYWGGVYYCETAAEAADVLRQIVLFEPPPVAHDHDTPADEPCDSCCACPMVSECELPTEGEPGRRGAFGCDDKRADGD
jgi:hypothetical protein